MANFEAFHWNIPLIYEERQTQVVGLPKSSYEPTQTLQKSLTSNPRTGFDPINCKQIAEKM